MGNAARLASADWCVDLAAARIFSRSSTTNFVGPIDCLVHKLS